MGLSYDQQVQERIASTLERIAAALIPAAPVAPVVAPAEQPEQPKKRRGRPPKVRNAENV